MYYIGIDVGTSALKTTVIDEAKTIVYEANYAYTFDEPKEGYREIDPTIWFQAVMKGMQDILQHFDEQEISVIGVTGQMHTTVFLDENGQSLRKAIMWNDLRSVSLVEELRKELTDIEETRYIAKIISPGSPAANTLWMKLHEPDQFHKICKIMTAYDYIVYRLCGQYSCDYCDASTSSMYDIVHKKWSSYMLNKLGINESYLGPIHASCDVIGTLLPSLCKELHIHKQIRVIAGTGDNPANAVAMGILKQSQPVISLGTSGVVIVPKQDQAFEGLGKNVIFSSHGRNYVNVVQGTVRSAGGTHKWWVENIVETDDMGVDQERISSKQLGNNGIIFFPHITGDKLIYKDITTKGAFIGLSAHSSRVDMLQAVLEGVSFALREVMENMKLDAWPKRIQINGGGTKSAIWMQIMANILHTKLEVVSMKATPGYGACLLARMVDFEDDEAEVHHVQGAVYEPEQNMVQKYNEQYRKYKRIYRAIKEITVDEKSEIA